MVKEDQYLKRCLQALKLTSKELANLLSSERVDGQKTSEATVSRWVTGATPCDPGVRLYLKTRLVELAKKMQPRSTSGKIIGLESGSEWIGVSYLAGGIAVTLKNIGYKVAYVATDVKSFNSRFLSNTISKFIDCSAINPGESEKIVEDLKSNYDFILTDLYAGLITNAMNNLAFERFIGSIDLIVTATDIVSMSDIADIERVYPVLDHLQVNNRLIVYLSDELLFDISATEEFFQYIRPWHNYLYPRAIPVVAGEMFVQQTNPHDLNSPRIGLQSPDLEHRYLHLSAAVLESLGVKCETKPIEELNFYELVDRVAPV